MSNYMKTAVGILALFACFCILCMIFLKSIARPPRQSPAAGPAPVTAAAPEEAMAEVTDTVQQELPVFNLPLPDQENPSAGDVWPEVSSPASAPELLSITTPHFRIYSYNRDLLTFLAARIERTYDAIVSDIGFYEAGIPAATVNIRLYRTKEEYREKTNQPEWSGGCISLRENAIYAYEGRHLRSLLPHELTHLMFNLFLENRVPVERILWLYEGLSVFEEMRADENYRRGVLAVVANKARDGGAMSVAELTAFQPATAQPETVSLWYAQCGALVDFLINERTKNRFYNFCQSMKGAGDADKALSYAYAGEFSGINDIDGPCRAYLQRFER